MYARAQTHTYTLLLFALRPHKSERERERGSERERANELYRHINFRLICKLKRNRKNYAPLSWCDAQAVGGRPIPGHPRSAVEWVSWWVCVCSIWVLCLRGWM